MRRRYLLLTAVLAVFFAGMWTLLDTRWGLVTSIKLASAFMPGELSVGRAEGSLLGPMHLRDVRYRRDTLNLNIQQLDLAWTLSDLLVGKLSVQDLQVRGVQLSPSTSPSTSSFWQQPRLLIPFAIDVQHARISNIRLQTASPLMVQSISLSALMHKNQLTLKQLEVNAYQAKTTVNGTVSLKKNFPLELTVAFNYQSGSRKKISGHGRLQGNMRRLQLSQQLTGALQGGLLARAQNVLSNLQWQSDLTLTHLDLHRIQPRLPVAVVTGYVRAKGNKQSFTTESTLRLEAKTLGKALLHLQAAGNLALTYYQIYSQGSLSGLSLPDASFSLQAKGGREDIAISQLHAQLLKGRIAGQAQLNWARTFRITSQLDLRDLDIGQIAHDWPSKLNARLALNTLQTGQASPVHFSLRNLRGQLRGHAVSGQIDGQWAPQNLQLKTVSLNIAGTRVTAGGQLARIWDLRFHAQSNHLGKLLPSAHGKLDMQGVLRGDARAPRLTLQGKAEQLAYGRHRIGQLSLDMDMGLAMGARSFLELQAKNVKAGDGLWQTVQLHVRGINSAQHIVLVALGNQATLQMALHGQFRPWRWQGDLERFDLNETDYGRWQLQRTVRLQLAREHFLLSSFCLAQNTAHLCLQGIWSPSKRQARLDVRSMPLHLLKPWLSSDVQLDGIVNAQARLDTTAKGKVHGQFIMDSPDKSVAIHFEQLKQTLTLGASRLTATLDNAGLQADLQFPLTSGGDIHTQIQLPRWSPMQGMLRTQPVLAHFTLAKLPASVLAQFIPQTAQAKGMLAANLQVTGTLGEPHLRGNASWQGGSVLVTPLGIRIHNVSAELGSAEPNIIKFNIKANSGTGTLSLLGQTQLDPGRGWPTQASLHSHQLEVSNIPEAYILVDSNLAIQLQGNNINVSGDITLPKARLRPRELPTGGVPVSPDVVVVNAGKQTTLSDRWQLTTHVQAKLGDSVDFKGFGISGKLHGNLGLNAEPGKLILGQGEISISDGTYRLRGQDLTIRRGRLIFSNAFIDDPALDVEAVRVVNNVTAGVRLKGTLKQPQLTVFSEPSMPQSDALAYLLFGHALSQSTQTEGQSVSNAASALGLVAGNYLAKGIGSGLGLDELRVDVNQTTQSTSLVLGKYLSPKLYLRYYNGIAESSRILQLQYQLSRRVQIQTESGYRGTQSITGGDLFFTVEY